MYFFDKMNIYPCEEITTDVLSAIEKLIPQLSTDCEIPSVTYLEQIVRSEDTYLFLAEKDKIVGMLTIIFNRTPTGRKAWIEDVVVDEKIRGQGAGSQLIGNAIEFARSKGVSKIDLTSRPKRVEANRLYEKLGFKRRNTNVYRLEL